MEDEELDYNSIGMKNSAIDKLKGNTPTPIPLKPVGERQYGQSIVSSEIVDGRRKITTTTPKITSMVSYIFVRRKFLKLFN